MQRLSLIQPMLAAKRSSAIALPAASAPLSLYSTPAFLFSSGQVKKKESLREREDRRRELSKLMEQWQCTVGFEFHVQMNTKYKMFSSK